MSASQAAGRVTHRMCLYPCAPLQVLLGQQEGARHDVKRSLAICAHKGLDQAALVRQRGDARDAIDPLTRHSVRQSF